MAKPGPLLRGSEEVACVLDVLGDATQPLRGSSGSVKVTVHTYEVTRVSYM